MTNLQNIFGLVTVLGKNYDYLLYQDYNHGSVVIKSFFWSEKHIDALVKAGFTRIVPELPEKQQPFLNKVIAGELKPEDFADQMIKEYGQMTDCSLDDTKQIYIMIAEGAKYAASHNLEVVAHDVQKGELYDLRSLYKQAGIKPHLDGTVGNIKRFIKGGNTFCDKVGFDTLNDKRLLELFDELKIPDDVRLKSDEFYKHFNERFYDERISQGDMQLVKYLEEHPTAGKTAFLYGAMHGNRFDGSANKDIDERLGEKGKKVGKIALLPNAQIYADITGNDMQEYPLTAISVEGYARDKTDYSKMKVLQLKNTSKGEIGGEISLGELKALGPEFSFRSLNFQAKTSSVR